MGCRGFLVCERTLRDCRDRGRWQSTPRVLGSWHPCADGCLRSVSLSKTAHTANPTRPPSHPRSSSVEVGVVSGGRHWPYPPLAPERSNGEFHHTGLLYLWEPRPWGLARERWGVSGMTGGARWSTCDCPSTMGHRIRGQRAGRPSRYVVVKERQRKSNQPMVIMARL